MNVRIFWVRAMKCMCAQTRPRFILSSEGVFWGNGVWTHVNSKGKISSTGKCPHRSIEPATLWQRAQALPTELFRPRQLSLMSGKSSVLNVRWVSCLKRQESLLFWVFDLSAVLNAWAVSCLERQERQLCWVSDLPAVLNIRAVSCLER